MPAIRNWVIVTAAAFLALPLPNAWARDCKRHPSLCAQSAEAKTANAAAPRAAAAVQKRKARVAKRTQKLQTAANPSRAAREQSPAREAPEQAPSPEVRAPADGPAPEPPVKAPSLTTTTIDWAVMLPQPLANAVPAALAKRHDQPALAAAAGAIALPGDDTQSTGEVASVEPSNEADAAQSVPLVNSGEVNEIDLAAVAEPAPSSWLRYVLATLGALLAAASTIRALFV
jgi:hypothetical protein